MAIAAAAVSVVGGVTQSVVSAKKAKKTREAIQNYKRQELTNAYKDVGVSTLAAELQREELARVSASSIQALQAGGIRGVVGGIGKVQQSNVQSSGAIGADLDRQQKAIDQLRASDEVRIQGATERREEQDLAGLGNQLNVQNQATMAGINTAVSGAGSLFGAVGGATGAVGAGAQAAPVAAQQTQAANPFAVTNPFFTQTPQLPYPR